MGIICSIFGHKYKVAKIFGPCDRKLKCKRCGAEFGMSDRTQSLVPWDGELEEVYYDF